MKQSHNLFANQPLLASRRGLEPRIVLLERTMLPLHQRLAYLIFGRGKRIWTATYLIRSQEIYPIKIFLCINWWSLMESNHSLRIFSPTYNNHLYESSAKLVGILGIEPRFPLYQSGFLTVGRYAYICNLLQVTYQM